MFDFEGEGEPYGPVSKTVDLLGDGSIRLLSTPRHTKGHVSVLLRVGQASHVLLLGDAVYTLESIRTETLPLLTVDDEAYLRSLREIKTFAAAEAEAVLVPSHDANCLGAVGGRSRLPQHRAGIRGSDSTGALRCR